MNFKNEIAKLRASKSLVTKNPHILKVPVYNKGKLADFRFYVYFPNKADEFLGKGQYGSVHKIYPIDSESGLVNQSQPWAVKIILSDQFDASEAKIFSNYYKAENPIEYEDYTYFICEYFPGDDLFNEDDELNEPFVQLNLSQRLSIIQELCMAINLFHHDTKSTGTAIAHRDVKGRNIKVFIDPKTTQINVYFLDLGFAKTMTDENPTKDSGLRGTPLYLPPETLDGSIGIKGDIYALAPIIGVLLGTNPFIFKEEFDHIIKVINTKYQFNEIFNGFQADCAKIPFPIVELTRIFLNKMQDSYAVRPNTDETTKFFMALFACYEATITAISNTCQKFEVESDPAEQSKQIQTLHKTATINCAKMILLACDDKNNKVWNSEDLSLVDNFKFSNEIIGLYKNRSVTPEKVDEVKKLTKDYLATKINYTNQIATLENSASQIIGNGNGPWVFKIPANSSKQNTDHRYYVLDDKTQDEIGRGTYGVVYKVYPIGSRSGLKNKKTPWALKVFSDPKEFNQSEIDIFSRYYKAEQPIKHENQIYFICEYFPGENLLDAHDKLNKCFENLTLSKRLAIIQQLCIALNLFQHETSSTGEAIAHRDIKGRNVKVFIDPETQQIHIYFLDFGFSEKMANTNLLQANEVKGTLPYLPPENCYNSYGVKSDIYALSPLIAVLLGADPFVAKKQFHTSQLMIIKAPYKFEEIFKIFENDCQKIPFPIADLTRAFLNRMQDDYDSRPDADETTKFFMALYSCFEASVANDDAKNSKLEAQSATEQNNNYQKIATINCAKMMLLAHHGHHNRLWYPTVATLLMHYKFAKGIVDLYNQKSLTRQEVESLEKTVQEKIDKKAALKNRAPSVTTKIMQAFSFLNQGKMPPNQELKARNEHASFLDRFKLFK